MFSDLLWFTQMVASKRLQQAQAQVGEVVDIMRVNVEKVLERDQKLSELDRRADDLQEGASQFQQQESTKIQSTESSQVAMLRGAKGRSKLII